MTAPARSRRFLSPIALTSAVLIFVLAGCLPFGLGDPEKAKIDPKLVGQWFKRDDNGSAAVMDVIAYDARTYLIFNYAAKPDAVGAWERTGELVFKAWLSEVKGQTFITMQVIGEKDEKSPFIVAKIAMENGSLTARGIQAEFIGKQKVDSAEKLRQVIEQNLDNDEMYVEPQQYFRTAPGDEQMVGDIMSLFRGSGS